MPDGVQRSNSDAHTGDSNMGPQGMNPKLPIAVPATLPPQKRKRPPRASIACEMCRVRKTRCNQDSPACSHCVQYGIDCVYPPKRQNRTTAKSQGRIASQTSSPTPRASRSSNLSVNASASTETDILASSSSTLPRTEPQASSESTRGNFNQSSPAQLPYATAASNISDPIFNTVPGQNQSTDPSKVLRSSTSEVPKSSGNTLHRSTDDVDPMVEERSHTEIISSDNIDEVNDHTSGTEFFGASGTLPFLARLIARSRGSVQHGSIPPTQERSKNESNSSRLSLVNFLHSVDYSVPTRQPTPEHYLATGQNISSERTRTPIPLSRQSQQLLNNMQNDRSQISSRRNHSRILDHNADPQSLEARNINDSVSRTRDDTSTFEVLDSDQSNQFEIEKKCIDSFFGNLHHIHPILKKDTFICRCTNEMWSQTQDERSISPSPTQKSKFLALYYAVCAVGAITASEETVYENATTNKPVGPGRATRKISRTPYPPLRLARKFFEQAKLNLGDIFETCSFESSQALFLMSVFCQNALKPHSCYMYSGMAARTSLAIGVTNVKDKDSTIDREAASSLWWCIYAHEMEMCCASGRDTLLRSPEYYSISLTSIDTISDPGRHIVSAMVSFSTILQIASEELYHPLRAKSLLQMSQRATELDDALLNWKQFELPPVLNLDTASLRDPEWLSKQKVVLKLRFWNARIILHRQFLVASGTSDLELFSRHVRLCLDASCRTIQLLYETYLNRHYFRTWWYNTTYVLYASMIILYLILLNFDKGDTQGLVSDVEKSLEILEAMDKVHVAHRCAQLIAEVLEVAKKQIASRQENNTNQNTNTNTTDMIPNTSLPDLDVDSNIAHGQGNITPTPLDVEILSNLVDFNLLSDFAEFTDVDYFFLGGPSDRNESYLIDDLE